MKKYQVIHGNVYIFPAQRVRVIWGFFQGDEGYLVGWKRDKDNNLRCVLVMDSFGKVDLSITVVKPIPKNMARSSDGSAA